MFMEESRECPVKKSSKLTQNFFQKSFPSPLSLGMRPLGLTRIDEGVRAPAIMAFLPDTFNRTRSGSPRFVELGQAPLLKLQRSLSPFPPPEPTSPQFTP